MTRFWTDDDPPQPIICPVCDRRVSVTSRGVFRKHRDSLGAVCLGSGIGYGDNPDLPRIKDARMAAVAAQEGRRQEILSYADDYVHLRINQSGIARAVGVTRERVRQILLEEGYPTGYELLLYRQRWRRFAHAVAYVARRTQNTEHGTQARYAAGCGCDRCRAANTARHRASREKHGRASPLVCAVCGESVWPIKNSGTLRHYGRKDHQPVPVAREDYVAA